MPTSQPWKIDPFSGCSQVVGVTKFNVEAATLDWREGLDWKAVHGPENAPHSATAERTTLMSL